MIAFRLGAHGRLVPTRRRAAVGGTANASALFSQNCASCHTLAAAHANGIAAIASYVAASAAKK